MGDLGVSESSAVSVVLHAFYVNAQHFVTLDSYYVGIAMRRYVFKDVKAAFQQPRNAQQFVTRPDMLRFAVIQHCRNPSDAPAGDKERASQCEEVGEEDIPGHHMPNVCGAPKIEHAGLRVMPSHWSNGLIAKFQR